VRLVPLRRAALWVARSCAGLVRAGLEHAGTPIGPYDVFIAAHALSLGAVLETNKVREFGRVPMLEIENWMSRAN
jgi:tRNA(fMet)-specific endonuclease VapC